MKTNVRTLITFVALFATLAISFSQYAPMTRADVGGVVLGVLHHAVEGTGGIIRQTIPEPLPSPSL
jgi:hypothetical protein